MELLNDLVIAIFYRTYYEEQRILDQETEKPIVTTINLFRINRLTGGIHYVKSWTEYNVKLQNSQNLLKADEPNDRLIISATLEEV